MQVIMIKTTCSIVLFEGMREEHARDIVRIYNAWAKAKFIPHKYVVLPV